MNGWRLFNWGSYFIGSMIFFLTLLHTGIILLGIEDDLCYYIAFVLGMCSCSSFVFLNRRTRIRDTESAKDRYLRIDKVFENIQKQYIFQEKLLENMFTMVDNIHGMAMWIKDAEDRYMFADKTLRTLLLDNRSMGDIIGKTDSELALRESCNSKDLEELIRHLEITDYPTLDKKMFENKLVCNITDVITRARKAPCRFYEEIGELSLDVWKTPVISSDGVLQGTVGCLVNVSKDRGTWQQALQRAANKGLAFKIDGTKQYILKDYGFGISLFKKNFEEIVEAYEIEKHRLDVQLKMITTVCSDAIVVVNKLGRVIFWNPMAEQLFGYSKAEIMCKNIFDFLIPEKNKEKALSKFEDFKKIEANEISRMPLTIATCKKDGSILNTTVSLAITKMEEDCSIIGIVRPVYETSKEVT